MSRIQHLSRKLLLNLITVLVASLALVSVVIFIDDVPLKHPDRSSFRVIILSLIYKLQDMQTIVGKKSDPGLSVDGFVNGYARTMRQKLLIHTRFCSSVLHFLWLVRTTFTSGSETLSHLTTQNSFYACFTAWPETLVTLSAFFFDPVVGRLVFHNPNFK